jgi:Glycosyltransferase family 87
MTNQEHVVTAPAVELDSRSARREVKQYFMHAAIATVLLCLATVGYCYRMADFPLFFKGINDFLPRYSQARMVGTGQMYSIEAGYREQDRAIGAHVQGEYHDRLPWQALLMAPLCRLPYLWAYWIWIGLNLAAFGVLVRLWLLPRGLVLWGVTFLPLAGCLILGQDAILLTLCVAGTLWLSETRRDFAAGLLLALCTAKPHLFVLVPLALMAHRRWRMLCGAAFGTAGLLLAGTAAAGWDWPLRWWAIVKALAFCADGQGCWVSTRSSVFQFGVNPVTTALALLLAAAFGVLIWRSRSLDVGIALAIVGSILVAPHAGIPDLPLLLVALPVLPLPNWGRWLRIALLTPIPYWALFASAPWNALLPGMLLVAGVISFQWSAVSGKFPVKAAWSPEGDSR